MYSNTCLTCKDRDSSVRYIGDSARTMFLRWLEHMEDIKDTKVVSHMRDHIETAHPELMDKLIEDPKSLFSM